MKKVIAVIIFIVTLAFGYYTTLSGGSVIVAGLNYLCAFVSFVFGGFAKGNMFNVA